MISVKFYQSRDPLIKTPTSIRALYQFIPGTFILYLQGATLRPWNGGRRRPRTFGRRLSRWIFSSISDGGLYAQASGQGCPTSHGLMGGEESGRSPRRRAERCSLPLHSARTCVLDLLQYVAGNLPPSILQRSAKRPAVDDTIIYLVPSLAATHVIPPLPIQRPSATTR